MELGTPKVTTTAEFFSSDLYDLYDLYSFFNFF